MMGLPARLWRALGLVLAGLAVACPPAARADNCSRPLSMGTGQWEPYAYYDANRRFTGLDADMTRAIVREAGCTLVELPAMPAIRNLTMFEKGEIDLMSGASRTPGRLKIAWFSLAYRDETVGMFALADQVERYRAIRSFADFLAGPLSVVAPRAGWYGLPYENGMPSLQKNGRLSRFGDFGQGIRMLAAGRASFMLGDAAAVEHAAAREGVKVQPLPFWVEQAPVHLMLNRATVTEADVRQLDAAIVRLQKRGVFEQIRRSYGGM